MIEILIIIHVWIFLAINHINFLVLKKQFGRGYFEIMFTSFFIGPYWRWNLVNIIPLVNIAWLIKINKTYNKIKG